MNSSEILAYIRTTPDCRGECDDCHRDGVDLWEDPDTIDAGDFCYCDRCWRKRAAKRMPRSRLDGVR